MSEPDAIVTPLSVTPLSRWSRDCRAARRRSSGRTDDPGTVLDGQDEPAVSAGLHLGASAEATHGAADPEHLVVDVAARRTRRVDERVREAVRQARREDRLARLVERGRLALLVVPNPRSRADDEVDDPDEHEDRQDRTQDAQDEEDRQETDERAPVRDDQLGHDLEEAVPELVQEVDDRHRRILDRGLPFGFTWPWSVSRA